MRDAMKVSKDGGRSWEPVGEHAPRRVGEIMQFEIGMDSAPPFRVIDSWVSTQPAFFTLLNMPGAE